MWNLDRIFRIGVFVSLTLLVSANTVTTLGTTERYRSTAYPLMLDCSSAKSNAADIVDKLISKDFEGVRENFDENMKKNLSAAQIASVWNSMVEQNGPYKSRDAAVCQETQGGTGVYTRLQMDKARTGVEVWTGPDGKVAGLWVRPA